MKSCWKIPHRLLVSASFSLTLFFLCHASLQFSLPPVLCQLFFGLLLFNEATSSFPDNWDTWHILIYSNLKKCLKVNLKPVLIEFLRDVKSPFSTQTSQLVPSRISSLYFVVLPTPNLQHHYFKFHKKTINRTKTILIQFRGINLFWITFSGGNFIFSGYFFIIVL